MEPFIFDLGQGQGGVVSGLKSFPSIPEEDPDNPTTHTTKGKPLIFCLHGASYCAKYFDAHKNYSMKRISDMLALPILAINRPGYMSTPEMPKTQNIGSDTHLQNEARWLHRLVLPTLWRAYGPSLGATSLVLLGHSVGAAVSIIVASKHSTQLNNTSSPPGYPLSGIITSGLGTKVIFDPEIDQSYMSVIPPFDEAGEPMHWHWNHAPKTRLMLNSEFGQAPRDTIIAHEAICTPSLNAEKLDFNGPENWPRYFPSLAKEITIPVMYFLGSDDQLWEGTIERVEEFAGKFEKAPRVERGVLGGAGHCIELSWLSMSWYTRAVAFAMCCATEAELLGSIRIGLSPEIE